MSHDLDRAPGPAGPASERPRFDSRGASRSNFLAFIIGGLVIALGSLAFLYHDGRQAARDLVTTGSIPAQTERDGAGRGVGFLPLRP